MEHAWSKQELRAEFSGDEIWDSGQLLGGIHFLKSCQSTIDFLEESDDIASLNNFAALRDPLPGSEQHSSFVAHRHDQSVLSLGAKRRSFLSIPDETYFAPDWNGRGSNYPIWASRLCSGNPNLENTIFSRVRRELERRLPF